MKWLDYMPEHWQENVRQYLSRPDAKYPEISVADFTYDLRLIFEDGSNLFFRYAFYLSDDEAKEVAVFTEHCGYHVFPFGITRLEVIDRSGNFLRSESFLVS